MTSYHLLLQMPNQKMARPFNVAGSIGEAAEMLEAWGLHHFGDHIEMNAENIDTETPVLTYPFKGQGLAHFFLFRL